MTDHGNARQSPRQHRPPRARRPQPVPSAGALAPTEVEHPPHEHHYIPPETSVASESRTTQSSRLPNWLTNAKLGNVAAIVALAMVGLLVLAIVIAVPYVLVPNASQLTPNDYARGDVDVRSQLLQALGGLTIGLGVYFTAKTLHVNREGQVTGRFTAAVLSSGEWRTTPALLNRCSTDGATLHGALLQGRRSFQRHWTHGCTTGACSYR
jgi:hypothetical protein